MILQTHRLIENNTRNHTQESHLWSLMNNNMCVCVVSRLHKHSCIFSIGVMVFILYKLYFLSPYPKPTPHTKLLAFLDSQNTSFCVIYKIVSSWGPKKCPYKVNIYCYCYACGDIHLS